MIIIVHVPPLHQFITTNLLNLINFHLNIINFDHLIIAIFVVTLMMYNHYLTSIYHCTHLYYPQPIIFIQFLLIKFNGIYLNSHFFLIFVLSLSNH